MTVTTDILGVECSLLCGGTLQCVLHTRMDLLVVKTGKKIHWNYWKSKKKKKHKLVLNGIKFEQVNMQM